MCSLVFSIMNASLLVHNVVLSTVIYFPCISSDVYVTPLGL